MSLVGWNCQGVGAALTGRHLKFICHKYRPPLVFLSEIRANISKVDRLRRRLGYDYAEYVEPVNTGGGLLCGGRVLWCLVWLSRTGTFFM